MASSTSDLRAAILTREFPPDVYGGAGVHVDFLVRELRELIDVDVHCMGEPRDGATAHTEKEDRLAGANAALQVLSTDLAMTAAVAGRRDVVHSHTWYANMAGHWAKLLYDVPHVVTAHSLEPQPAVEGRAARRRLPAVARGPSGRRTRRPTRWSRSARGCATTSSRRTRRSTRTGCT